MKYVEVASDLAKKLRAADERVALFDPQGNIVGYYHPVGPQPMSPELLQWAKEQISDEELDRRSREPGGITTEELLKRLDNL